MAIDSQTFEPCGCGYAATAAHTHCTTCGNTTTPNGYCRRAGDGNECPDAASEEVMTTSDVYEYGVHPASHADDCACRRCYDAGYVVPTPDESDAAATSGYESDGDDVCLAGNPKPITQASCGELGCVCGSNDDGGPIVKRVPRCVTCQGEAPGTPDGLCDPCATTWYASRNIAR